MGHRKKRISIPLTWTPEPDLGWFATMAFVLVIGTPAFCFLRYDIFCAI